MHEPRARMSGSKVRARGEEGKLYGSADMDKSPELRERCRNPAAFTQYSSNAAGILQEHFGIW